MEEKYFSGYCRRLDAARLVEAVFSAGLLEEADCDYGSCPFEAECTVAKSIRQEVQE